MKEATIKGGPKLIFSFNFTVVGEVELKYRIGSRLLSRKCGAIGPIDAQSVFVPAPYWQPPNFAQTEPELSNLPNSGAAT